MENVCGQLKSLGLSGMADSLAVRVQEAKANEMGQLQFLENVISDEFDRRAENVLNRRVKAAKFPQLKTLDDFNFSFNPNISKMEINELMTSKFVYNAQNILFIGPPGVGKTHLSLAIGLSAIHNGYTVHYKNAFDLVEEMLEADRDNKRKKYINQILKFNLLIIDEFGMKKMPPNVADDMLEIIHRRYCNGSTIITTNRVVSDWAQILGDNTATSAILDRFLHGVKIFNIKGKSYRLSNALVKNTK